jgi:hypothetical protein
VLSKFLRIVAKSQLLLKYICRLPPMGYVGNNYFDWIEEFIEKYYDGETKTYKDDRAKECFKIMELMRPQISKIIKETNISNKKGD